MASGYKEILSNKNFLKVWFSQALSQIAANIMNFLFITNLFEKTGSTIATSFLWVSYSFPAIIIGPFAAAFTDMVDRKQILVFSNFLQALAIFLYAMIFPQNIFVVYFLVFVYSMINQFYVPSESASIPSVVKKKNLPNANGFSFMTQQTSMIIGFGTAGFMSHFWGFRSSLFVCAGLLFLAFISVNFLPSLKMSDKLPKSFEKALAKFFKRIVEGYHYIRQDKYILLPLGLLMTYQTILSIVVVNIPIIAKEIVRVPLTLSGIFIVVPAGIGALVAAALVPAILKKGWRKKIIIETSMILMIIGFAALFSFSIIKNNTLRTALSDTAIALAGFSYVGVTIPSLTFLQEKTKGGLRGRVFGNFWFLSTIVTVIPVVFSGTVTDLFGVRVLFVFLFTIIGTTLIFSKKYTLKLLYKK